MSENLKWQLATGVSTPEEVNEALLNLRGDLAAERKRREDAEQNAKAHADAFARAERAEGQQRSDMAKMQKWRERAERAEADNAALLKVLREAVDRLGEIEPRLPGLVHDKECQSIDENWADECDCSWSSWKRSVIATHPGATLLERMRAVEALRALAVHDEACQKDIGGSLDSANCATCAFDALKPETT